MADYGIEAAFVAQFWSSLQDGHERDGWRTMATVGPEALEVAALRTLYELLRQSFSAGEPVNAVALSRDLLQAGIPPQVQTDVELLAFSSAQLDYYAREVMRAWQRREFSALCAKATKVLQNGKGRDGGRALADRMAVRLMSLYAEGPGSAAFKTRDQLLDDARLRATEPDPAGVTVPWPKLEAVCGPWMPGEVVAVSGYSGSGKSTFAAALFFGIARRGVPCLAFPTEMRERWLDRALAQFAGVEQWRAEKRRWRGATEQRDRFLEAAEAARAWPWLVVNRADLAVLEVASAVRVLRRRWPGETVVVLVDHMHRLDYGERTADEAAGDATKLLKNLASDDAQGGLVMVLLYQPRKPADERALHRPTAGYQIRGHSSIWNELDVHLSVYRSWVKTSPLLKTAWGTPSCLMRAGRPRTTKPRAGDEEGDRDGDVKLDDEHCYVKVDKRRIGGEGPTIVLDFDQPSGRVYERPEPGTEEPLGPPPLEAPGEGPSV